MSVDSILGGVDDAISGKAADQSKAKKESKAAAGGGQEQGFVSQLVSTLMGNNNKDVPGAGIPAGPTTAEIKNGAGAKTTGFADGVDGKVAPQQDDSGGKVTATDAATDPQAAAKQSGEDTVALLMKIFTGGFG